MSKQSWGWWFETPSLSLWHHCNEQPPYYACRCIIHKTFHMSGAMVFHCYNNSKLNDRYTVCTYEKKQVYILSYARWLLFLLKPRWSSRKMSKLRSWICKGGTVPTRCCNSPVIANKVGSVSDLYHILWTEGFKVQVVTISLNIPCVKLYLST